MKEINHYAIEKEYLEYLELVKDIDESETVKIEYYPLVVKDNQSKVFDKFSADTTPEEITDALEKSKYHEASKRDMTLLENGFSKFMIGLFAKIEKMDELDEDTILTLGKYALIEPEIRKKVTLSNSGAGYYLGGHYHEIN